MTAVRFYKGTANTGTHVGHLWSANGVLLAEATFTNESASGWQEVALAPPVAITANTTYVASYHADPASSPSTTDSSRPPASTSAAACVAGWCGRRQRRLSLRRERFPTAGSANNYWVDVVLQTDLGPDTTPPVVLNVAPAANATNVALATTVRATFSEAIDPASLIASTFVLRDRAAQQSRRPSLTTSARGRRRCHDRGTACANHVYRHAERRHHRRKRSRRQRARVRLRLVVHDRRATAAAR